jgi:hypothetical protein
VAFTKENATMITRGPYTELPNGDLQCTITISADQREHVMRGGEITLAQRPGGTPRSTIERVTDLVKRDDAETVTFSLVLDDTAAAPGAPPTQTIATDGVNDGTVMKVDLAEWKHPAAAHIRRLFMYEPFQRFAMTDPTISKMAAPMPTAIARIRSAAANGPNSLDQLMSTYYDWARMHNVQPLPSV